MDLCERINSAKCCVVQVADAYVKARTFGVDTDEMLTELLLLNAYVKALEKYECDPKRIIVKHLPLTNNGVELTNNGAPLTVKTSSCECVDPDSVNCLTESEVCNIMHEIAQRCDNFICGC